MLYFEDSDSKAEDRGRKSKKVPGRKIGTLNKILYMNMNRYMKS